jgi:hypothetical protein
LSNAFEQRPYVLRKWAIVEWVLDEVDQEDPLCAELFEQLSLVLASWLATKYASNHVPEEVIVSTNIFEEEVPVQSGGWRLSYK